MTKMLSHFLLFALLTSGHAFAVGLDIDMDDDDLNIGGDIFSDFNEDIENSKVLEDERFYKHGRFFTFQIGIGVTSFTGNRGAAYEDQPPSFTMGLNYFLDFSSSFGLGVAFSKHHFFLEKGVKGYQEDDPSNGAGMVEVSMLRAFFNYRYYIDTVNLGTAVTYSNPYLTGRFEYWYMTNTFIDQEDFADESGGGVGFGIGGGLEFPIVIKESYIGIEVLWHTVNLPDKYTQDYQPLADKGQSFGYEDFTGDAYTVTITYVMSW
ncbi:MAG: hypothetical protein KAG61_07350 [Bacteriovoracaceae bacterium]|nr:hypothetical protein [Bacteriovoracaceae bacterium]